MIANEQLRLRRIGKTGAMPYYHRIASSLRDLIMDTEFDEDGKQVALPSESELCAIYQVTRATVRHALDVLEREGLIYRERGRGTFLRRRRVQLDVSRLSSTTEELRARGWQPGVRILGLRRMVPRPHVQRTLHLSGGQEVWETHRLRLADGEPISLQWSYISCEIVPDLDQHDVSGSLWNTLRHVYGIELTDADLIVRARPASTKEAELLEIEEGAPVFFIEETSYSQDGQLIEYEHGVWRGDRYELYVHQRRD